MAEIPHILHYCWFGRSPLPKNARKCIESWRKFFPGYEIKEWNEDNFDIDIHPYVRRAYDSGKYAFASDYARFWILYNYGGVYFDTDVEVIRDFGEIAASPFMGIETDMSLGAIINPGMGMGSYPKMAVFREFLGEYDGLLFDTGTKVPETVVEKTTRVLRRHGFDGEDRSQDVAGIRIYPSDVFCPLDHATGLLSTTDRTVSIHYYAASWLNHNTLSFRLYQFKCLLIRLFGKKLVMGLAKRLKR